MTRISFKEDYDDRSVVSKIDVLDKDVGKAQETVNETVALVNAKAAEVDATVTAVANAIAVANTASANAQTAVQTANTAVSEAEGYGSRISSLESGTLPLTGGTVTALTVSGTLSGRGNTVLKNTTVADLTATGGTVLGDRMEVAGLSVVKGDGKTVVSGKVSFTDTPVLGGDSVGGDDRPVYLENGVLKPVTGTYLDSTTANQTVNGLRVDGTDNRYIRVVDPNYTKGGEIGQYSEPSLIGIEGPGSQYAARITLGKHPTGDLSLRMSVNQNKADNPGDAQFLALYRQKSGTGFATLKYCRDGTNETDIVTKGWAMGESTNGNNLVHTQFNEEVGGNKTWKGDQTVEGDTVFSGDVGVSGDTVFSGTVETTGTVAMMNPPHQSMALCGSLSSTNNGKWFRVADLTGLDVVGTTGYCCTIKCFAYRLGYTGTDSGNMVSWEIYLYARLTKSGTTVTPTWNAYASNNTYSSYYGVFWDSVDQRFFLGVKHRTNWMVTFGVVCENFATSNITKPFIRNPRVSLDSVPTWRPVLTATESGNLVNGQFDDTDSRYTKKVRS